MRYSKLIIIFLFLFIINNSFAIETSNIRKQKVEIKEKSYILLTYTSLACKDCFTNFIQALRKFDKEIKIYCLIKRQKNVFADKQIQVFIKKKFGLESYFYDGDDSEKFEYSPNIIITNKGEETFIKYWKIFGDKNRVPAIKKNVKDYVVPLIQQKMDIN